MCAPCIPRREIGARTTTPECMNTSIRNRQNVQIRSPTKTRKLARTCYTRRPRNMCGPCGRSNAWRGFAQHVSFAMSATVSSVLHGCQLVASSFMFSMAARSYHDVGKRVARLNNHGTGYSTHTHPTRKNRSWIRSSHSVSHEDHSGANV